MRVKISDRAQQLLTSVKKTIRKLRPRYTLQHLKTHSPQLKTLETRLRPNTVRSVENSLLKTLNSPAKPHRTHAMSSKVPYAFRFNHLKKEHFIVTQHSPMKPPRVGQPNTGVAEEIAPGIFVTPKKNQYQKSADSTKIITPHGHRTEVHTLTNVNENVRGNRKINYGAEESPNEIKHEVTVLLSYKNISSPQHGGHRDNVKAHGGQTADAFIHEVMKKCYREFNEISKNHHEWTHGIAGRWGVVKNIKTGQHVDPAAATSTFAAPAHFNSEMILFEKFADYLVYANYHRCKIKTTEPTVEYTMRYTENKGIITYAEVEIKDLVSGIKLIHGWDHPSAIDQAPSVEKYEQKLELLKKTFKRELSSALVLFSKGPEKQMGNPSPSGHKPI